MNNLAIENVQTQIENDKNTLFNFLDHTVLLITQARNANDIDLLMDDFMSDDVLQVLSENRDFFSLLNVVWFSTFKRIFIDTRAEGFPLKVLWLPVLFKQLGWEIEDIETFEEANFAFRSQTQYSNDVYKHLVELFLNGLKFELDTAFDLFKNKVQSLEHNSDQDRENIETMLNDIESMGWKTM